MRTNLLAVVAGSVSVCAIFGIVTAVVMPHENLAVRALALKNYAMRPLAIRQDLAAELLVKRGDSSVQHGRRKRDPAGLAMAAAAINKRDVATSVLPTSPPPAAGTLTTTAANSEASSPSSSKAETASGTVTNRIPYPQWSSTSMSSGSAPSSVVASMGAAGTVETSGAKSVSHKWAEKEWIGALRLGVAGTVAVLFHLALLAA